MLYAAMVQAMVLGNERNKMASITTTIAFKIFR
jgi:hypothetical protein